MDKGVTAMASKRGIRRKSCTGKRRYVTVKEAKYAIYTLTRAKGYTGTMNTYMCPFCNGYHVGHAGQIYRG
jgi:hypothetical protein